MLRPALIGRHYVMRSRIGARSRALFALAATVAAFTLTSSPAAAMPAAGDGGPVVAPVVAPADMAPCLEEDGPAPCYWDAGAAGNGLGLSFTATPAAPGWVCLSYWDPAARGNDACVPDPYALAGVTRASSRGVDSGRP